VLEDAAHLVLGLSSASEVDADILPPRAWREMRAPEPAASSQEVERMLGRGVVHSLTADQLRRVHVTMPLVDGDVDGAVRRLTDNRLFSLGTRTPARRGWDSLIVDDTCMRELVDLTDRYRFKSAMREEPSVGRFVAPGVLAVFAGPSGTGKTLAAEVISHELGLELVKIDLSTVVSKYIGETEKNLDEVFDAAAMGGALVLFDEGDALFGKRSEVSEAKDRYANIEVAYLLQRVETFEGFVIISTNLAGNIDTAFQRRLHGMVTFANPERPARARLWDLHLPAYLCADDIDREKLANLPLAGGGIRNAAVAAAFLAMADGTPIERQHLRIALQREYQKLNRLSDAIDL
jgi:AAA+ superfamily predicted ATPase